MRLTSYDYNRFDNALNSNDCFDTQKKVVSGAAGSVPIVVSARYYVYALYSFIYNLLPLLTTTTTVDVTYSPDIHVISIGKSPLMCRYNQRQYWLLRLSVIYAIESQSNRRMCRQL